MLSLKGIRQGFPCSLTCSIILEYVWLPQTKILTRFTLGEKSITDPKLTRSKGSCWILKTSTNAWKVSLKSVIVIQPFRDGPTFSHRIYTYALATWSTKLKINTEVPRKVLSNRAWIPQNLLESLMTGIHFYSSV